MPRSFPSEIFAKDDYYEAIFQIRPNNKEVIGYFLDEVSRNKVYIAKIVEKKFGTDFYLSSRKLTVIIAKKMKKRFHGETKVSKTLYSRNRLTSKLVYRLTVLFRLKEGGD